MSGVNLEHCVNNTYYVTKNQSYQASYNAGQYWYQQGRIGKPQNPARPGNTSDGIGYVMSDGVPGKVPGIATVLPNCVGFAVGRFNEIANGGVQGAEFKYTHAGNAKTFYEHYEKNKALKVGKVPAIGAYIVWSNSTYGHIAIVEDVHSDGTIDISESGWSMGYPYVKVRSKLSASNDYRPSWMKSSYKLAGFVYQPNSVPNSYPNSGGREYAGGGTDFSLNSSYGGPISELHSTNIATQVKTVQVTYDKINTADITEELNKTKSASLLSYPTMVEAPYIIVKIGDYTFGAYNEVRYQNYTHIDFPNFIRSLHVTKVNGNVNQYTLEMVYQIRVGDDPNFVDKVLSTVGYGNIEITYGDCSSPSFVYRNEVALITNVKTNVNFSKSQINYTVSCVSTCFPLAASSFNFPVHESAKPSDIIYNMLYGTKSAEYGLLELFRGMVGHSADFSNYVATDDKPVKIEAKPKTDALSYINYLVSCMISESNPEGAVLLNSSYYMVIEDDTYGDTGGSYFKVVKVESTTGTLRSANTYEVDVGYPSENMVTRFDVTTDKSWALLYKYGEAADQNQYVYNIDNEGNLNSVYSPGLTTSTTKNLTTPNARTWWTQMTQFPITATITIKGLIRPAMLMTYLRVNAFFYGQRHIASGLYIITKQEDSVSGSGYRTTLSLTRIAGDNDYITRVTETRKVEVPVFLYDQKVVQNVRYKGNVRWVGEVVSFSKFWGAPELVGDPRANEGISAAQGLIKFSGCKCTLPSEDSTYGVVSVWEYQKKPQFNTYSEPLHKNTVVYVQRKDIINIHQEGDEIEQVYERVEGTSGGRIPQV